MGKQIQFQYTLDARKKLSDAKIKYVNDIKNFIKEKKYVSGDKIIEITVSDIEDAVKNTKIKLNSRRNEKILLIYYAYLFMGIFLIFWSIFYKYFKDLLLSDPISGFSLIIGFFFVLVSSLSIYLKKLNGFNLK